MGFVFVPMVSDPFTGSDGDPLSGSWDDPSVGFEVNGNRVRPSAVDETCHAAYDAVSWPAFQYARCKIIDASGIAAGTDNGAGLKLNNQDGTTGDFYYAMMRSGTLEIKECDANFGNSAGLVSKSFTPQANDELIFTSRPVNASLVELSLYLVRGGVTTLELQTTDAVHQGGRGGIYSRVAAGDVVSDGLLDDFEGGEVVYREGGLGGGGFCAIGECAIGEAPADNDNVELTVTKGDLTLAGKAVPHVHELNVTKGDLTLAGKAVVFVQEVNVVKADLALQGKAVPLVHDLNVVKANLTLTGQNVGLSIGTFMPVVKGDLTLTGKAISTVTEVNVVKADLSLSGKSVPLVHDLNVVKANLTLTGKTVVLVHELNVAKGDLVLTGQNVVLNADENITLPVVKGDLTLTGKSVPLTFTLTVVKGNLSTSGKTVVLVHNLNITKGDLALTGKSIGLVQGTRLAVQPGQLSALGSVVAFRQVMTIVNGALSLTGADVGLLIEADPIVGSRARPGSRSFGAAGTSRAHGATVGGRQITATPEETDV